jgi:hypothetical protein
MIMNEELAVILASLEFSWKESGRSRKLGEDSGFPVDIGNRYLLNKVESVTATGPSASSVRRFNLFDLACVLKASVKSTTDFLTNLNTKNEFQECKMKL